LRTGEDPQEVIRIWPENRVATALLLLLASVVGAALFVWVRVPFLGSRVISKRKIAWELLLAFVFYSGLFAFVLPAAGMLHFLISIFLALVWGSLLDITYHQGLPTSGGLESSRSLDCDRFGFWFLNGENRHAEHHAYPWVPGPHLATLSNLKRSALKQGGVVYEAGYTRAFLKSLFTCPVFLPPESPEWKTEVGKEGAPANVQGS
jgi:fatty acid desaturase